MLKNFNINNFLWMSRKNRGVILGIEKRRRWESLNKPIPFWIFEFLNFWIFSKIFELEGEKPIYYYCSVNQCPLKFTCFWLLNGWGEGPRKRLSVGLLWKTRCFSGKKRFFSTQEEISVKFPEISLSATRKGPKSVYLCCPWSLLEVEGSYHSPALI